MNLMDLKLPSIFTLYDTELSVACFILWDVTREAKER